MSKHTTFKSSHEGRERTLTRKRERAAKRALHQIAR